MEVLHGAMGHAPPGPRKKDKILRNVFICLTVAAVVDRFELEPTGRSPRRRSACKIVSEALADIGRGMGRRAVETIWETYGAAMPTVPGWTDSALKSVAYRPKNSPPIIQDHRAPKIG